MVAAAPRPACMAGLAAHLAAAVAADLEVAAEGAKSWLSPSSIPLTKMQTREKIILYIIIFYNYIMSCSDSQRNQLTSFFVLDPTAIDCLMS